MNRKLWDLYAPIYKRAMKADQHIYEFMYKRIPDVSLNNTLLIALQRPDASLVAGYNAWKKDHGRQVRKGEKGIKI